MYLTIILIYFSKNILLFKFLMLALKKKIIKSYEIFFIIQEKAIFKLFMF